MKGESKKGKPYNDSNISLERTFPLWEFESKLCIAQTEDKSLSPHQVGRGLLLEAWTFNRPHPGKQPIRNNLPLCERVIMIVTTTAYI